MKIELYLLDKIVEFRLPNQISGSFSFDWNETDSKLINIKSKDNKWYLYSTSDVKVSNGNTTLKEIEISNDKFYILIRDNIKYLIYVSSLLESKILTYNTNPGSTLLIGNDNKCNIKYACQYIVNNAFVKLSYNQTGIVFERQGDIPVYINKMIVKDKNKVIKYGDEIDIYGLRITLLKNLLFINKLNGVNISAGNAGISQFTFKSIKKPEDIEVKDKDLYSKEDYASKAPRIRRTIEEKEFSLNNPPSSPKKDEMPAILVVGPMITMGIISFTMVMNCLNNIISGAATLRNSWPQILSSIAILLSSILWPTLTRKFQKKIQKKRETTAFKDYNEYLQKMEIELEKEYKLEKTIIEENLVTLEQCLENINKKNINFWSKRIDQNDFLVARIGKGKEKLHAKLKYDEDSSDIETNELKNKLFEIINKYSVIEDIPVSYSFYENIITAIMGNRIKTENFVNNIILQFISFYSYEDLKIVVFTNKNNESSWKYLKYLNHTFSNDKTFRFFASDYEGTKNLSEYLNVVVSNRVAGSVSLSKPHYLILCDDYDKIKKYPFLEKITESDKNLGFSLIIMENLLSKLPSKCDNFITLNGTESGILKNSYEGQEQIIFNDEINSNIDMMDVTKKIANVPVELEESVNELPESISFLEMEQIGNIEQLNILNRWNTNDSSASLKSEIGVDEHGDLLYLDLHEKFHGPHGLIAGTTGSGKSEFIITYILSMAINYSPDEVSFILIDYKGGGVAFAFENKATGAVLPHLAGTITNLDKAEMDRTLVSIDSEIKRRQYMFNNARDILGESTIDIYKYQKYYKDGVLKEPIPHLFIICDEFAELKVQQPDFMDNLISVARIGRSLGVHLILATQKPSGVVNDQIWSNSKFKVCLKVQDESDSNEMLKKTDAAYLKQAGRFYLQVGYDELFAIGQSGWCGAKYYPSDKIVKQVDKSINFIDDCGICIKSIQASGGIKIKAEGDQLSNVLNEIIGVSKKVNKKSRKLWLDNIPDVITLDYILKKYKYKPAQYNVCALVGEYDAPEKQEQGLVKYNLLEDGNTLIYGNDGIEREKLLETILFSSTNFHSSEEINYYIIDYGSESFRKYSKLPHIGGIVLLGEEEKYNNLIKLIKSEIQRRKKLFTNYGGEYNNYIKHSNDKLPIKVIIINNYDSVYENNPNIYEDLPELTRDSERYGFVFILTGNSANSIQSRISQNFHNSYAFKLKDSSDYSSIFGVRCKSAPREILGRGMLKNDGIHEFQVASIHEDYETLNQFIMDYIDNKIKTNSIKAEKIPSLPNVIKFETIASSIDGLRGIPVGLDKTGLEPVKMDCTSNLGILISSNKIENTKSFMRSLISLFNKYKNMYYVVIDAANYAADLNVKNYYNQDYDKVFDEINNYISNLIDSGKGEYGVIVINGLNKFITKLTDTSKLNNFVQTINKYEKISVIVCDDAAKIKKYAFETWYTNLFTSDYGLWIGRGISEQNLFRVSNITKEMTKNYNNDMGYFINEGYPTLVKLIDLTDNKEEDIDEE